MASVKSKLQGIELKMLHRGETVFSGPIKNIPKFTEQEQTVDCVKFLKEDGSLIMSMNYREFENIVEDTLL